MNTLTFKTYIISRKSFSYNCNNSVTIANVTWIFFLSSTTAIKLLTFNYFINLRKRVFFKQYFNFWKSVCDVVARKSKTPFSLNKRDTCKYNWYGIDVDPELLMTKLFYWKFDPSSETTFFTFASRFAFWKNKTRRRNPLHSPRLLRFSKTC